MVEEEEEEEEDDETTERRPWEEDDFGDGEVLDLTGGAGDFSHPPFNVRFPGAGELPRAPAFEERKKPAWEESAPESTQPSAPTEEEVPPDRRPTAPVITPLAPLAPASPPRPEIAPRRGPSGSMDETPFALPAASPSLMQASAEKMDLQEQPSISVSADQEDVASLLHESSASLPSLSPLSVYPVNEQAIADSPLPQPPLAGDLQEPLSQMYLESTSDALIVENPDTRANLQLCQTEMQPALAVPLKSETLIVHHTANEKLSSEEQEPLHQIAAPKHQPVLFDEPFFLDDGKTGESGSDEHVSQEAFEQESPVRADYVDFKPFAPILQSRVVDQEDIFESQDASISAVDTKLSMIVQYEDKTGTLPESVLEPADSCITPSTFQAVYTADEKTDTALLPLQNLISENKTDEKKIAEMQSHWSAEQDSPVYDATSPFAAVFKDEGADYVTTDRSPNIPTVLSVPESLTPDLVQEACESVMHDAAGAQLTYTSTIDLVQPSESLLQSSISAGHFSPSYECTETVPSPVLPDIVMEAPDNTGATGIETTSLHKTQPGLSPLEDIVPLVHEEQIKLESEKPPSYEDAVKVSLPQDQQDGGGSIALKGMAQVMNTALEEIETPYISIACDLIKETKISNEYLPPGFTDFSENALGDLLSQSVHQHCEKDEDSSPESEEVDSVRQLVPEVKEEVSAVMATRDQEAVEAMGDSTIGYKCKEVDTDVSPGKVYMESFQPELDLSKDKPDSSLDEPKMTMSIKEEKPLQMEELGNVINSGKDLFAYQGHEVKEAPLSTDKVSPAPITEDLMTLLPHSKAVDVMSERKDIEIEGKETEKMRNVTMIESGQACSIEFPCVVVPPPPKEEQVKAVEIVPFCETAPILHAVHPLPAECLSSIGEDLVSAVKPRALAKETATEHFPKEEKSEAERSTPLVATDAVLSTRLAKTSVVDLLYWRDIKKTGVVFGASLFLLLSLTVFSIVSVSAYIALALLSVTISYRIYKGVFQAIQKSDEGHPFRAYLDHEVALSEELIQKYSNVALGHLNCTVKELRRLFLVEDLVDSLKFAVLMWVLTYVGALFNGLTLLILALISLFSIPVIYERHQAQIDHYLGLVNKTLKDTIAKVQSKIPGLKPKAE
uniref:Reticulon n=2 Tax=Ambystoma mexicanum TaxID=8296 RepID=M9PSY2_AMBME|nr:reticulon 4 isoform A [Ambystoma mexicanum]